MAIADSTQQTNDGSINTQLRGGRATNSRHLNEYESATALDRHFARSIHAEMCDVEGYWHSMVMGERTALFFKELPRAALDKIEDAGGSVESLGMTTYAITVRVVPAEEEN